MRYLNEDEQKAMHRALEKSTEVVGEGRMSRSPAGYESEHLQNVRRTLESGLQMAQHPPMESGYIDLFTHALDELRRAGVEFPDS